MERKGFELCCDHKMNEKPKLRCLQMKKTSVPLRLNTIVVNENDKASIANSWCRCTSHQTSMPRLKQQTGWFAATISICRLACRVLVCDPHIDPGLTGWISAAHRDHFGESFATALYVGLDLESKPDLIEGRELEIHRPKGSFRLFDHTPMGRSG